MFQSKLRNEGLVVTPRGNSVFGEPSPEEQFQCDCFMIMPFAEKFQPIYEGHIKPVAEKMGLEIRRGDDFFSTKSVMADVWSAIVSSRVIVAECTDRNPNVFYELGIAHSLDKAGVMITQKIDDIPFDIRHLRVIEYEPNSKGFKELERKLEHAIGVLL